MSEKLTDGCREKEDVDGGIVVEPVDERHSRTRRNRTVQPADLQ